LHGRLGGSKSQCGHSEAEKISCPSQEVNSQASNLYTKYTVPHLYVVCCNFVINVENDLKKMGVKRLEKNT
jgi:hypothetical protein